MASISPTLRPLSCWKSILRHTRRHKAATRSLTTYHKFNPSSPHQLPTSMTTPGAPHVNSKIKTYPPPPSPASQYKEPIKAITAHQIALLDPTGARTTLFSKANPDGVRVGDILLVRQRSGDPVAGVCLNIRRRGVDTGILLRNELTRVGVEMWFKIYSPNVEAVEVVQRKEKRARRARLTYLRKKKHDLGSLQGVVSLYLRQRAIGVGSGGREGGGMKGGKARGKGKGKR